MNLNQFAPYVKFKEHNMKYIKLFLLLLIGTDLFAQSSDQFELKINESVKNSELSKMKLEKHDAKIGSVILQKVNAMLETKKQSNLNLKEMQNKFSDSITSINDRGEIRVKLAFNSKMTKVDFESVQNDLINKGITILIASYPEEYMQWRPEIVCLIEFSTIKEIAKDNRILSIMPASDPITNSGYYITEGDKQLYAELARNQKGINGSTIKVGVISNGAWHVSSSQASGELGSVKILSNSTVADDEGTAMMEIIYDIAPGCSLSFAYAGSSSNNMKSEIQRLIGADGEYCKIVVDDIGWFDDPWFSDGELAQYIHYIVNTNNVIYISSAGNEGMTIWSGFFTGDNNNYLDFYHQGSSANIRNYLTLPSVDNSFGFFLQWEDSWSNPQNDYDLYLYNSQNNQVAYSTTRQGSGYSNPPLETISYNPGTSGGGDYYLVIKKYNGIECNLKVNAYPFELQYTHPSSQTEASDQIFGHSAALGAISVAAYHQDQENIIADYSSRGPTRLINNEIRETPTITATSNVSNSVYLYPPFDGYKFSGTSASAPHIAGIAALYRKKYGSSKTPAEFREAIIAGADAFEGGSSTTRSNKSGYGKANTWNVLGGGPIRIIVDQQNASGSSVGIINNWDNNAWSDPVDVPIPVDWYLHSTHTIRAAQNIIDNQKFHNWNKDKFINHEHFYIKSDDPITANLKGVNESVIKTSLISGGSGGVIKFKDPWLWDYNEVPYGMRNRGLDASLIEYGSPLNVTTASAFQGVFLEQGWPGWNPPYYSVRAEEQQTIPAYPNILWYFQYWDGTNVTYQNAGANETPLVFNASNAEARAVYKGHLASNKSRVTGYNNGRRIVKDNNGTLHMVYDDGGLIWLTTSSNGGQTWTEEQQISFNDDVICKNPSIAYSSAHHKIFIVWEATGADGLTRIDTYPHGYYVTDNGSVVTGTGEARPVVAAMPENNRFYIAWRFKKTGTSAERIWLAKYEYYQGSGFEDVAEVPGGPNNYPAMEIDQGLSSIVFLWAESGKLHYNKYTASGSSGTWKYSTEYVFPGGQNIKTPACAMSFNSDYVYIAYEDMIMGETPTVNYAQFNKALQSPILTGMTVLEMGSVINSNPSISYYNGTKSVLYNSGENIVRRKLTGSTWTGTTLSSGKYANIAVNCSTGAVWTKYNNAPYLIGCDYPSSGSYPITPIVPFKPIITHTYAITNVSGDTGYIMLKLNKLDFNNSTINFAEPLQSDTVIAPVSVIPVELEMEVTTCNLNSPPASEEVLFKVDFIDGSQTISLTNLRYHEIPDTSIIFTKSITANNLHYREGFLRFGFVNLEPLSYFTLAEVDTSGLEKESAFELNILPARYILEQNYPNPFNPLTYISFSLPEAGNVHLEVFDINGHKIKELISGQRPAGQHQYIFNGEGLASGIYFYRLQVNNYSSVKRMLMVK